MYILAINRFLYILHCLLCPSSSAFLGCPRPPLPLRPLPLPQPLPLLPLSLSQPLTLSTLPASQPFLVGPSPASSPPLPLPKNKVGELEGKLGRKKGRGVRRLGRGGEGNLLASRCWLQARLCATDNSEIAQNREVVFLRKSRLIPARHCDGFENSIRFCGCVMAASSKFQPMKSRKEITIELEKNKIKNKLIHSTYVCE